MNRDVLKKMLLLPVLLLISLTLSAQIIMPTEMRSKLRGKVTDALTGEPVKGATVSLLAAADSTVLQTQVISNDSMPFAQLMLRLVPRFLGDGNIEIGLPTEWMHKSYDYFREGQQHLTQSELTVNPSFRLRFMPKSKQPADGQPRMLSSRFSSDVGVSLRTRVPDITQMVVYRDDSDPLNVRLSGGSDLKH